MESAERNNVVILTQVQKDNARRNGRVDCPECKRAMRLLATPGNQRDEFYCEQDHISVPMF